MPDTPTASDGPRVAVVTGGNRGIGRAVVERFAAQGLAVIATGRDRSALDGVAKVASERGWDVTTEVCDVSDAASVEQLFDRLPRVDVLVPNAGVADSAPLHKVTLQDWERHLAVNATGVFLALRAALPGMQARDHGRVVVVASVAGLSGTPYTAAYNASKHAAVGLVRSVALDVAGSGVTVNAVCPGWVRTDMTERAVERIVERTGRSRDEAVHAILGLASQPRLVEPDEVAAAVTFLASDDAAGINGQTLVIDAGGIQR